MGEGGRKLISVLAKGAAGALEGAKPLISEQQEKRKMIYWNEQAEVNRKNNMEAADAQRTFQAGENLKTRGHQTSERKAQQATNLRDNEGNVVSVAERDRLHARAVKENKALHEIYKDENITESQVSDVTQSRKASDASAIQYLERIMTPAKREEYGIDDAAFKQLQNDYKVLFGAQPPGAKPPSIEKWVEWQGEVERSVDTLLTEGDPKELKKNMKDAGFEGNPSGYRAKLIKDRMNDKEALVAKFQGTSPVTKAMAPSNAERVRNDHILAFNKILKKGSTLDLTEAFNLQMSKAGTKEEKRAIKEAYDIAVGGGSGVGVLAAPPGEPARAPSTGMLAGGSKPPSRFEGSLLGKTVSGIGSVYERAIDTSGPRRKGF